MRSVASENTLGLMESNTRANGVTTKCTEKAHSSGRTRKSTRASLLMTNEKDMVLSVGLTAVSMSVSGELVSNMAKELT